MFNLKFNSLAEAMKVNEMTEAQLVSHLKTYLSNQNYRTDYNQRKNQLNKLLKNDPVVQERYAALTKKKA